MGVEPILLLQNAVSKLPASRMTNCPPPAPLQIFTHHATYNFREERTIGEDGAEHWPWRPPAGASPHRQRRRGQQQQQHQQWWWRRRRISQDQQGCHVQAARGRSGEEARHSTRPLRVDTQKKRDYERRGPEGDPWAYPQKCLPSKVPLPTI